MKTLLILAAMLVSSEASAWGPGTFVQEYDNYEYKLDNCKEVNHFSFRCENKEVICYVVKKGGLSCKFKD